MGKAAAARTAGPSVAGIDWGRAENVERPTNYEASVPPDYPGTHPILRIAGQAKEFPARAAQFTLQRLNAGRWNMEALLEKCFNDVHECERWSHQDTIDLSGRRVTGVFVRPRRASECERPSGPACIVPPRLFRHHRSTRF